jgi:O-antigen ligase
MTIRTSETNSELGRTLDLVITVGVMVAMFFTALAFGTVEPWSLAVFSLIVVALLVLWVIKGVVDQRMTINAPPAAMPLAALLLVGFLQSVAFIDKTGKSLSISLDVEATRMTMEVLTALFIALLIAASFLTGSEKLTWLRNFLIFFGLGLAVFGLAQYFTWNGKYYWVVEPSIPPSSPFGPFVNHNHFAGYMEMIVPIPAALILMRVVRGELSIVYGFATVIMAVAAIASLSRGGMISLAAGLIFVVAFGIKPAAEGVRLGDGGKSLLKLPLAVSRAGALAVIVLTIGVGVSWVGADPVIRRVEKSELIVDAPSKDPGKETFFQSRGWIWRDTAAMIRDNWVTGVGLGAYQTAYPIYSKRDGTLLVSQAHNDYLQILADCGIFGAIIALWFIYLVWRDTARALRHRDPKMAATALGCAGGMFALFVHSLFDFNLQLPSNALLFLVLTSVVSQVAASATEGRVSPAFLERAVRQRMAA